MNILLTSIGRRSYLVDYFKQALKGHGLVLGANSDVDTSAMHLVDKAFKVPFVNSKEYIPEILDICTREDVGLVVSLFDIDLPYLAAAKSKFEALGICLAISDKNIIDIANDKWQTYCFLLKNKLPTPITYKSLNSFESDLKSGEITFPVIVKPRWGMGSLSVYKAKSLKEVRFFVSYCKNAISSSYLNILSDELEESVLIQEFIVGKEFGIDVFNDLEAKNLVTVVKEKLAMRSGETDAAIVTNNPLIKNLANQVGEKLKHVGNLDIDILLDENNRPFVLEFNARFGGGYPFSHLAGVDFPALLIQMAEGSKLNKNLLSFKVGTKGMKFIEPKSV